VSRDRVQGAAYALHHPHGCQLGSVDGKPLLLPGGAQGKEKNARAGFIDLPHEFFHVPNVSVFPPRNREARKATLQGFHGPCIDLLFCPVDEHPVTLPGCESADVEDELRAWNPLKNSVVQQPGSVDHPDPVGQKHVRFPVDPVQFGVCRNREILLRVRCEDRMGPRAVFQDMRYPLDGLLPRERVHPDVEDFQPVFHRVSTLPAAALGGIDLLMPIEVWNVTADATPLLRQHSTQLFTLIP